MQIKLVKNFFVVLCLSVIIGSFFFIYSHPTSAAGTISGNVYLDNNNNGTDDGISDPGVKEVGVRLWNDLDNSNTINTGDTIATGDTTDSSGNYTFSSQADGDYLVDVYDPTDKLSIGNYTDLQNNGIVDVTISGISVSGINVGFKKAASVFNNQLKSTVRIDDSTANGPTLSSDAQYGVSAINIGDLDRDGISDIAVGASSVDTGMTNGGGIFIHFLNSDGSIKSTTEINQTTPNGPPLTFNDFYGSSIANLGDLDNDGVTDIAVGSFEDDSIALNAGSVYIHYLNTNGSVKSTVEINGSTTNGPVLSGGDLYGRAIANMGDLDDDGVTDIAVGAFGDDTGGADKGSIYIHYLNTDASVKSTVKVNDLTVNGPTLNNSDLYGHSVTNMGDIDGDGVSDIAVGAPTDDTGGTNRGAVHISYLNSNGTVKSTVKINHGTANGPVLNDGDLYGFEIQNVGDLDGDRVSEIAVGAVNNNPGASPATGDINISYLNGDGSIKSTFKINGSTLNGAPDLGAFDYYGSSIANIGDLDGDGKVDIAVGAMSGNASRGKLYIHFSGITGFTTTYNGNGNTGGTVPIDGSSPYINGSTVTVLDNTGSLVRTGFTFSGWNTTANGSGTNYAPAATFNISANTILYAQWASEARARRSGSYVKSPTTSIPNSGLKFIPNNDIQPIQEKEPNVPAEFSSSTCVRYLREYIVQGKANNRSEVEKLQKFLNESEGEKLTVDGNYDIDDVNAVKRYQEKYRAQILSPWGLTKATGIVGRTTVAKINLTSCSKNMSCPYFSENLKIGSVSLDTVRVQDFLNIIFAPTLGYPSKELPLSKEFTIQTAQKVKEYQAIYKDTVLKPLNLRSSTGWWYDMSRKTAHQLMGCQI